MLCSTLIINCGISKETKNQKGSITTKQTENDLLISLLLSRMLLDYHFKVSEFCQ